MRYKKSMGAKDNLPTKMQAEAMTLILEGEKPKDAMIKAGYSPKVAKDYKPNLLELKGVQSIIEQYKAEYTRLGITPVYMVKKTKEWLEAQKIKTSLTEPDQIVPDYPTQLKAAEYVRQDWGMGKETNIEVNADKVLIMPSSLMEKYGLSSDPEYSSEG